MYAIYDWDKDGRMDIKEVCKIIRNLNINLKEPVCKEINEKKKEKLRKPKTQSMEENEENGESYDDEEESDQQLSDDEYTLQEFSPLEMEGLIQKSRKNLFDREEIINDILFQEAQNFFQGKQQLTYADYEERYLSDPKNPIFSGYGLLGFFKKNLLDHLEHQVFSSKLYSLLKYL